jgi:hypothetical protein
MARTRPFSTALAAVALLSWSAAAFAQREAEAPPVAMLDASPMLGHVEGKIGEVTSTGSLVTMLRLEDGTRLTSIHQLPVTSVGDTVTAQFVDSGAGDKVVTAMRNESEVQAP